MSHNHPAVGSRRQGACFVTGFDALPAWATTLTAVHGCFLHRQVIYVLRYTLIALSTVFWGSAALVMAFADRSGASVIWIARTWLRWVMRSCGIRVAAEGLENIDPQQPCILMSNHQSVFDIAALIDTLPIPWKFVVKRELVWIPFFGWALAAARQIIIDRGDREKAVRSLARAASAFATART